MKIIQGTRPIIDPEIVEEIGRFDLSGYASDMQKKTFRKDTHQGFLDRFATWVSTSRLNNIRGLETFPHQFLTAGATQAIDEFHWLHRDKRIRLFNGEYPYHGKVLGPLVTSVESEPLRSGDALILSLPFTGSGDKHARYDWAMEECSSLQIPVLIDCAYFGTCSGIDVTLDAPCIESVCISLSKCFSMGNLRTGIWYTKTETGHVKVQNESGYAMLLPAAIGTHLMENFGPDFLFEKYRPAQIAVCSEIKATPTNTVMVGVSDKPFQDDWIPPGTGFFKYGLSDELMDRV